MERLENRNPTDSLKETEKVLTGRELAKTIGVSFWAVWKWTRQGKIPCIRVNKRIFYRLSSVLKWLSEIEAASLVKPEEKPQQYGVLRRID